ncbi:MAG: BMP family ABC transporter substrate-binding protein [Schwartzia sp.]|nr:BMP family ABC transporter substrate-binding protein [Schwartzia sp. (in: firmicutes)]
MRGFDDSHRVQKFATGEWLERNLPLVMMAGTVFALIFVILSFRLPETGKHVTVGCVLVGSMADGGWNESHYEGLMSACSKQPEELSVQQPNGPFLDRRRPLVVRDNVPEEKDALLAAVDYLIDKGCNVIFLTSFGYGQYMDEIAKNYPRVAFFGVSGEGEAKNCTSYFARLYQVRYLAGIIAGYQSRTGVLGYVGAKPNVQSIRSINAYALGMRLANPQARLIVRYTGSWDDEKAERESVAVLQAEGADVISYHADKPNAIKEAEARGLFSIGYDAVRETYSDRFLTAALYDWAVLYKKVLDDYLKGGTNFSRSYWLGLSDKAVKLHPLSPAVEAKAVAAMEWETLRMTTDWDVFSGQIYDNEGRLRCDRGERISDEELFFAMDWYVEGVEIYE